MPNRRKQTTGLNTNQVKDLTNAWWFAPKIGLPLNALVTIRPLDVDEMTPGARCELFARVRNKLGIYARQHEFEPTFAWSREVNEDGTGEHMHVLMHVPRRWRRHFEDLVIGWFPNPGETDVTDANQRVRITASGKRHSAIGYIMKQMDQRAWWKRGLTRKRGGPLVGKRGGVTKNLDWRAQAAFRADRDWPHLPAYLQRDPAVVEHLAADSAA